MAAPTPTKQWSTVAVEGNSTAPNDHNAAIMEHCINIVI